MVGNIMYNKIGDAVVSLIGCLVLSIGVILAVGLTIAWIWAPIWVAIIVTVIPGGVILVMGICFLVDRGTR